jgi:ERCC4-type nuclease
MIKLIVDNRESIKNEFSDIENIEITNLSIGDYQFVLNDELFIIIERKTITDYASSIKDGRLREQKKRLIANKGNAFILYLVEGDLSENNKSFKYNKVEKNTIISSIINIMMRDNINVFHTTNKDETLFFIKSIYRKLAKQGNTFLNNKTDYNQDLVNNLDCSKNKSENLNPKLCFQMMLNCIPTISNKISMRISNKFENLYNFILFMEEIENNKIDTIVNIRMSDDDKARKISKTSAKNILLYFGIQ